MQWVFRRIQVRRFLHHLVVVMWMVFVLNVVPAIGSDLPHYPDLDEVRGALETLRDQMVSGEVGSYAAWTAQLAQFEERLAVLSDNQADTGARRDLALSIWRLENFIAARNARPDSAFGLMTADSMTLVYPFDLPCLCSTDTPRLSMAQGEYESIQAVVLAFDQPLQNVQAEISLVLGPDGQAASDDQLQASVAPLGFVHVIESTHYTLAANPNSPAGYQGWVPDPIREDIAQVDVPAGAMQPFWIELFAGREAPAGTYTVTVTIRADGVPDQMLQIEANVWPFSIQDRPHLPTAMTTNPEILDSVYGFSGARQRAPMWEKYMDFLHTFKIEPDSLYHHNPPTVDELFERQARWGLRQFNVYNMGPEMFDPRFPETWQDSINSILDAIAPAMEQYEQAGLADKAYIYGFDESRREYHRLIKAVLRQVKERYPHLRVMTTMWEDPSLGLNSDLLGLVDIWAPYLNHIESSAYQLAQATGDQAYWYIAVGTVAPQPNWFNGKQPSDARLLLGPLSFKMKVDGFLYYYTNFWTRHGVMNDGIMSEWDARTWVDTSGDGSLFYPGSDGPLASQRIQNFRDGMEDYNLLVELAVRLDRAGQSSDVPDDIIAYAKHLLTADDIAPAINDFTKDAVLYRAWRDNVATTIIQLDEMVAGSLTSDQLTEPTEPLDISALIRRPIAEDDPTISSKVAARAARYQRAWISHPRGFVPETGPFPVNVFIHPDVEVENVMLMVGGEVVYADDDRPEGALTTLELPDGTHQLELLVTGKDGQVWQDVMTVIVQTSEIKFPKPGGFVRGTILIWVATVFDDTDLSDVTVTLTPIRVGNPYPDERIVVARLDEFSTQIPIDTTVIPDGAYLLEFEARHQTGRITRQTVNIVIDNWERTIDQFQLPTQTWFGLTDFKKTIFETDGWSYDDSDPQLFFSDGNRRVWQGEDVGHLIWEVDDVEVVKVDVYTIYESLKDVVVSTSEDGEVWTDIPLERRVREVNAFGWYWLELMGEMSADASYVRLEVTSEHHGDAVQLGRAEFRSLKEAVPIIFDENLLFSFESGEELSYWTELDLATVSVSRARATAGNSSAHFRYPANEIGWPALAVRAPTLRKTDWAEFGYFSIDIYNDNERITQFHVRFDDGHGQIVHFNTVLPPKQWTRWVIPVATIKRTLDVSDIRFIHLHMDRPSEPGALFFDNIRLSPTFPEPLGNEAE